MTIDLLPSLLPDRVPWTKGRIIGQKRPLLRRHVWPIMVRLEMAGNASDLALFKLAVDSKLRSCDLVGTRVTDVFDAWHANERALIVQSKAIRASRSGSRSPRQSAFPSNGGSAILRLKVSSSCGQAASTAARTCLPGSTRASFVAWSRRSVSSRARIAPIPCAKPRWRRFTRRLGTCVRSNSRLGIRDGQYCAALGVDLEHALTRSEGIDLQTTAPNGIQGAGRPLAGTRPR